MNWYIAKTIIRSYVDRHITKIQLSGVMGTYLRDYIYVKDAVQAYILLAEKLDDPDFYGIAFNFGSEKPIRILDLVNLMTDVNYFFTPYCLTIKSYPTLIVASIEILLSDFLILAQKTT